MSGKNIANWSTDDLMKHLKETHKTENKEIVEWLDDYLKTYPEMDFREHLWHLHEVHHNNWDALIPHDHAPSLKNK